MKIFGIAGWSGSGKTTLLTRLIPALAQAGIVAATVKHTHHNPSVGDAETRALALAGACEVLVASPRRFALIHELDREVEPSLDELVEKISGVDLVLVEGFKWAPHFKLEVWDPSLGKPLLAPTEPSVVGLASDEPVAGVDLPRFGRDDARGIAAFIMARCGM